jgi:hypothetical protein
MHGRFQFGFAESAGYSSGQILQRQLALEIFDLGSQHINNERDNNLFLSMNFATLIVFKIKCRITWVLVGRLLCYTFNLPKKF